MDKELQKRKPNFESVQRISKKYIDAVINVTPVENHYSTFTYQIQTEGEIFYIKFLPEHMSFGPEILAHKILHSSGIKVPEIIAYEDINAQTNLSMMIMTEIQGSSIEDNKPKKTKPILKEAGRQLAMLHQIPVTGFGFIDHNIDDKLVGKKHSFLEYYSENLENYLEIMEKHPYTNFEKKKIREFIYMERINLMFPMLH